MVNRSLNWPMNRSMVVVLAWRHLDASWVALGLIENNQVNWIMRHFDVREGWNKYAVNVEIKERLFCS